MAELPNSAIAARPEARGMGAERPEILIRQQHVDGKSTR
jgi:hypothetical protein